MYQNYQVCLVPALHAPRYALLQSYLHVATMHSKTMHWAYGTRTNSMHNHMCMTFPFVSPLSLPMLLSSPFSLLSLPSHCYHCHLIIVIAISLLLLLCYCCPYSSLVEIIILLPICHCHLVHCLLVIVSIVTVISIIGSVALSWLVVAIVAWLPRGVHHGALDVGGLLHWFSPHGMSAVWRLLWKWWCQFLWWQENNIPGNAWLSLLFLDNKPTMNIGDAFLLLHWLDLILIQLYCHGRWWSTQILD